MAFDPTGGKLDEGQLNWGYWWVTHQVQVRKAATFVFGIFAFSLLAYAIWGFADWFLFSGVKERQQAGLTQYVEIPVSTFRQYAAKTEPFFDDPTVLPAGEGRYDLFAKATNANENWMVTFDYRFEASGTSIPAKKGFLLPGETKRLHALGVKAEARPSSGKTVISNMQWSHVDPHLVFPGYAGWSKARLDIVAETPTFVPPAAGDTLPIGRATFSVVNRTAFSYYTVGFFVTAYSNQQVVGVNYVTISRLMAGERRTVEASWFSALPAVTRVEVMPEVNILDASAYIAPGK